MPPHIGGIELVAESLFRAYHAAGFEARWVAAREPSSAPARDDGRVRVRSWNALERRLGVPWPLPGIEGLREISRLVRWADLIHVHDCLYATSSLATLLARRFGKPVILSQHIGFVMYPVTLLNGIERLANYTLGRAVLRSATHIIFCTRAAEQFGGTLLTVPNGKSSVIPNGIDTDCFRPPSQSERATARRMFKLDESRRVALFVGRLVEKKGVDVLAQLVKRMPSHLFLVVGDGPLRTLISKAAENLTWLPRMEPESMAKVYHAADVFILPSHGEGLPLSVQEAMAAGLPAVVTRDEAFTSTLEREGACLGSARTTDSFQQLLERLGGDSNLASKLSARSRELALREWSMDVMTERYVTLIRELIARH